MAGETPSEPTKVPPAEPNKVPPAEPNKVPPAEPNKVPPAEPNKVPPAEPNKVPPAEPNKVQGPASYFPSIERTYGRPIEEWLDLVRASPLEGHKEKVEWLKSEHGLGHGHANALVAFVKLEG